MPIINSSYFGSGGTDTSDATAVASQILAPYTAYVANGKVTGTMTSQGAQTITPGATNQTIQSGRYLSGTQTILGDADLTPDNIAKGVSIFGVSGQARVVEYLWYNSKSEVPIDSTGKIFTLPGKWQNIAADVHFSNSTTSTMLVEQGSGCIAGQSLVAIVDISYSGQNTLLTLQYSVSQISGGADADSARFYVWKQ